MVGIVERSYFRATAQKKPSAETLYDCLHGFNHYVSFERPRWVYAPSETEYSEEEEL